MQRIRRIRISGDTLSTFDDSLSSIYTMHMSTVAILGAGSLGTLIGTRLKRAGHQVVLLVRSDLRKAELEQNGLRLVEDTYRYPFEPDEIHRFDQVPPSISLDGVVLTVKAYHMEEVAARTSAPLMDLPWLLLQNGVHHWDHLLERLNPDQLTLGITTEGAYRVLPDLVKRVGSGHTVVGPFQPDPRETRSPWWRDLLESAGFSASHVDNIWPYVWKKLLMNAVINPLTALTQVPNGALLEVPDLRDLAVELLQEAYPIVQRQLLPEWTLEQLQKELFQVLEHTRENRSSMAQDLRLQRPTELPWITGALLDQAREQGRALIRHEFLYRLIGGLQVWQQARGMLI